MRAPILLDLLKAKDMTIADLARETGLSPSFLSRLVNNLRWPGLHTATKIAAVLGVPATSIWRANSARPVKRTHQH